MAEFTYQDVYTVTVYPNNTASVKVNDTSFMGYPDIESPIRYKNQLYTVTNLSGCFFGCSNMVESPYLPDSVTNMDGCFYGCMSMEWVAPLPSNVENLNYCFAYCQALQYSPVIPNSVRTMDHCFTTCMNLDSAPHIPEGVANMYYCFDQCVTMQSIYAIPRSVSIMDGCFNACKNLEGRILFGGLNGSQNDTWSDIFRGTKKNITLVPLSDLSNVLSLRDIDNAYSNVSLNLLSCHDDFYEYTKSSFTLDHTSAKIRSDKRSLIVTVVPPADRVKVAGANYDVFVYSLSECYEGCSLLVKILGNLPDEVTDMRYCFTQCGSLEEAPVIPDNVQDMTCCFLGCASLVTAPEFPQNVIKIDSCYEDCRHLLNIPENIPSSVSSMYACFSGCTNLKNASIDIPSSVTVMDHCFEACYSLTNPPNIPNAVTSLRSCFKGCSFTHAPSIPSSVLDMTNTFAMCQALQNAPRIPTKVRKLDGCFAVCTSLTGYLVFDIPDMEVYERSVNGILAGTSNTIWMIHGSKTSFVGAEWRNMYDTITAQTPTAKLFDYDLNARPGLVVNIDRVSSEGSFEHQYDGMYGLVTVVVTCSIGNNVDENYISAIDNLDPGEGLMWYVRNGANVQLADFPINYTGDSVVLYSWMPLHSTRKIDTTWNATDQYKQSNDISVIISPAGSTLEFHKGGNGIGVGIIPGGDGLHIAWPTDIYDDVKMYQGMQAIDLEDEFVEYPIIFIKNGLLHQRIWED